AKVITDTQLLFPNAITTMSTSRGGFTYMLSPRTSLEGSVGYDHLVFNSIGREKQPLSPSDTQLLNNGRALTQRLGVIRPITYGDSIGVTQEYSYAIADGQALNATTHSFFVVWRHTLSESYTVAAEGGVSLFLTDLLSGVQTSPTGAATLTKKLRAGAFNVRV